MKKPALRPKMRVRTVKSEYEMEINSSQIIEWANGVAAVQGGPVIPEDATVSVFVPGGGDYSGMALDLGFNRVPLLIKWIQEEVTQNPGSK